MKAIKVAIVSSFALATAAFAASGYLFLRVRAERAALGALESENLQLEERSKASETQLAQQEKEVERFQAQIQDYVSQRESLKGELDQALAEAAKLKKKIQELEGERDRLSNQVNVGTVTEEALVEEAQKVVPVLPATPPTPAKVEGKAEPEKKSEKVSEKKTAKEEKPAPPAGVRADQRPNQVLSVNRKFNFVVVNLGLRDKLKIGDTLRVEQNGKLIGRLQVEKLYENFSACGILEEIKPAQIQEGDLVRIA